MASFFCTLLLLWLVVVSSLPASWSLLWESGGMGGQTIPLVLKLHKTKKQNTRWQVYWFFFFFFESWIKGQRFLSMLFFHPVWRVERNSWEEGVNIPSIMKVYKKHRQPLPAQLFFCCYWQSRVKIKIFFQRKMWWESLHSISKDMLKS